MADTHASWMATGDLEGAGLCVAWVKYIQYIIS